MPSARFQSALLGTPIGRIVAANMLAGLRLDLYDFDELCPLLVAWQAIVAREGYTDNEVPGALIRLKKIHVFCRLQLGEEKRGAMANVRQSHLLESCFHKDDIQKLRTLGIDPKARPGTANYRRSLETVASCPPEDLPELRLEKSLTNPDLGDCAILWYTKLESLERVIADCTSVEQWADVVRDRLGLIHFGAAESIAVIELPSRMTDNRRDCGRPTFAEAGLHSRFFCGDGPPYPAPWGTAVDLGASIGRTTAELAKLPERVCGRVPDPSTDNVSQRYLRVRFLGTPKVPRGDFQGVDNEQFARHLEEREAGEGRPPLATQLATLCDHCLDQTAKNDDGDL